MGRPGGRPIQTSLLRYFTISAISPEILASRAFRFVIWLASFLCCLECFDVLCSFTFSLLALVFSAFSSVRSFDSLSALASWALVLFVELDVESAAASPVLAAATEAAGVELELVLLLLLL